MKWFREMFSEAETVSWTRVTGAVCVLFLLFWATYLLDKTKPIPDIPGGWLTLVLGLYGINKTANTFIARGRKDGDDKATPEIAPGGGQGAGEGGKVDQGVNGGPGRPGASPGSLPVQGLQQAAAGSDDQDLHPGAAADEEADTDTEGSSAGRGGKGL